ncbi:MAG TPA: hypothetical protein VHB98_00985 [Chloroflexota bacterium]|nr:hypothetical protein [Chloroflexota bacterium]
MMRMACASRHWATLQYLAALLLLCLVAGIYDTAGHGIPAQFPIAVAAWVLLLVSLSCGPGEYRVPTMTLVLVASAFECVGSLLWGAYTYRYHNLPAYVPPGHGLMYLAALCVADLPFVRRHQQPVVYAVCLVSACWACHGLQARPWADIFGALCWLLLLIFLRLGRDPLLFAVTFSLTMALEFYGTAMGTWHWAPVLPGTGLSAGNPPSAIGAGYCVLDAVALCMSAQIGQALARLSRRRTRQLTGAGPLPSGPS